MKITITRRSAPEVQIKIPPEEWIVDIEEPDVTKLMQPVEYTFTYLLDRLQYIINTIPRR